jgi:nucleotide-binding universal stress UspA family protein
LTFPPDLLENYTTIFNFCHSLAESTFAKDLVLVYGEILRLAGGSSSGSNVRVIWVARSENSMYSKILVPLDGSERAEAILPHAESLATTYDAEIILLHIVEPHDSVISPIQGAYMLDQNLLEKKAQKAEKYLALRQNRLRMKGISSQIIVARGAPVEGIINTAERERVDLIAMASHGRTGLARVFYGSVAAGLLHRIDRPLLIIRSLDS